MSSFSTPIAEQIWDMKYRFKTATGIATDQTVQDSWHRVANALAAEEKEPEKWRGVFYNALEDFKFLPAGRILAGAGTGRSVTLFNCFVMGTVPDNMGGIFDNLREAALTMQQGGGIGYDFSTIRPKGAAVKGVAADASGPLSFMDVWDAMCRTIMSAGSRRGAMMATLRCDHPDIEAFIEAKQDPARLRMFNLSVLVTDPFMQAVKADGSWDLVFNGETYKTVSARVLWDRITRATFEFAEPGVIFIDRINQMNNLAYCETIAATNPCVTAETWVMTNTGARLVRDLVGRQTTIRLNGQDWPTGCQGFFATGVKPVLKITTTCGRSIRLTADHPMRKVVEKTRWRLRSDWAKAGQLLPGDELVLNDHGATDWAGTGNADEGYLIGLLLGDGTLKADKAVLSVWPARACANADPAPNRIMARAEAAARSLPHRADFAGWMEVSGRGEYRLATAALRDLALDLGMAPGAKSLTPAIEQQSSSFYYGFLKALFDADGTVLGNQDKGVSVRLAQSNLATLQATQRMLLRLGINSVLYQNRRAAGQSVLPDSKGGQKAYEVAAQHELVIANDNIARFAERIGFEDADKAARLTNLLGRYKRQPDRDRFTAVIAGIALDGTEPVFDVQVPGVNAFDADGFVAHNCGEQPLPPYGACLLGSINLAKLVFHPFEENAHVCETALTELVTTAVRMMDNVVDRSRFPLPQQQAEAKAKRRIGLGITGLADALLMTGLRYGSDAAAAKTEHWLHLIARAAYLASADLAAEKGAFPLYDRDKFLASGSLTEMDADVKAAIAEKGIRNALLTSIAPTGTISLYAGNVSSGIEPVFAFSYKRKVLQKDGSRTEEEVVDYAVRLWREKFGETPLPDHFVDAQSLLPLEHVKMQAAAQKWVDSSISKTINCPEDISFADFKEVYSAAWESGCKGCTTYRPNAVTGSVLSVSGPAVKPAKPTKGADVVYISEPLDRPETLEGNTYKIKWPESEHAIYITINDVIANGRRRPFEVFINSKNMEHFAWTVGLTRMISAVFRRGGDVSFVIEELKAVFDPRGGAWMEGKYIPSILAAIGGVIERHMIAIGFIEEGGHLKADPHPNAEARVVGERPRGQACPNCGQYAVQMVEGCKTCLECGHSKCS